MKVGVYSTPAFFINGNKQVPAKTYETLKQALGQPRLKSGDKIKGNLKTDDEKRAARGAPEDARPPARQKKR